MTLSKEQATVSRVATPVRSQTATPHNTSAATPPLPVTPSLPGLSPADAGPSARDRLGGPAARAAKVMATTGVVVTAAAGVLSPMSANKANTVGRLVEVAVCTEETPVDPLPNDATDPAWHQFVLPIAVVGGTDPFRKARGALFSTVLLLVAAAVAAVWVATRMHPARDKARKVAGVLFAVLLSFFAPNAASLASLLLGLTDARNAAAPWWALVPGAERAATRAVAGVTLLVALALWTAAAARVASLSPSVAERVYAYLGSYDFARAKRRGTDGVAVADDPTAPSEEERRSPPVAIAWVLAPLVESGRAATALPVRLHVVEDIGVAMALAVCEGLAVGGAIPCRTAAGLALAAAASHALYVVVVWPYRERAEQLFAVAQAGLQAGLAGAGLVAAVRSGRERGGALAAVGWLAFVTNVLFYIQLLGLFAWEARRMWHAYRRHLDGGDTPDQLADNGLDTDATDMPLLAAPNAPAATPVVASPATARPFQIEVSPTTRQGPSAAASPTDAMARVPNASPTSPREHAVNPLLSGAT